MHVRCLESEKERSGVATRRETIPDSEVEYDSVKYASFDILTKVR